MFRELAQKMYRALLLMPCACSHKWQKEKSVVVAMCRRCSAVAEYEAATAQKPIAPAVEKAP